MTGEDHFISATQISGHDLDGAEVGFPDPILDRGGR